MWGFTFDIVSLVRPLPQRVVAEFLGTLLLVAAVIGSGIMAERLSAGNIALALLCNTIATGAGLIALILAFGPISGAHLNPAVTLADALAGGVRWRDVAAYLPAQFAGGVAGTVVAHFMFGHALLTASPHVRSGAAQIGSEFVATFGLLCVIWGCSRSRPAAIPFAVGAYITAAYWFTASTSFANPAVTLGRAFTDTFSGIRPVDAPAFLVAQFAGALSATALFRWLLPPTPTAARELLVPHSVPAPRTFLFACTHNAGRSQMAAALFNQLADPACCRAISAGTAPAERVHPEVVQVMDELGVDLRDARPQKLDEALAARASVLVTMGCGEKCPYVPGLRVVDWALPDPKGQPVAAVRQLREEIADRVRGLLRLECSQA